MVRVNHARTDADEKSTRFGTWCAKLGHGSVQASLADSVNGDDLDSQLGDGIESSLITGNGDSLLGLASDNQGREKVKQVNVADDVDFETVDT